MIEEVVFLYLKRKLNVPVRMEYLEDAEEYVLIEKVGTSVENYIHSATFALQSYAGSIFRAAELNEEVKSAMDNLTALKEISKSKLNTDYNYTDLTKKKYRYQAIYDVYY